MLRHFLDRFGFDYEFLSATECYSSGRFDEVVRQVLRNWDGVMGVMLPTLREERRQTYSPVLPVRPHPAECCRCRSKSSTPRPARSPSTTRTAPRRAVGARRQAKLQWKVDWAARWVALGVDYEMSGKDLIDSVVQSSKIARVLGGRPPEGFNYEMFLDEKGEKISKSKGNGLSLEEWLRYGSEPSLAFYIYREPKKAKSLHLGLIPRAVDEYWQFRGNYAGQPTEQRLGNPVHHIHNGKVPGAAEPAADLRPAAQPRQPARHPRQGNGVAVRPALRAGHVGRHARRARRADRPCGQLCARLRRTDAQAPRAERNGGRGAPRSRRGACEAAGRRRRARRSSTSCSRSASAIRSKACATGSRRSTRPCSAPPGPAHGQLHRALRDRQQPEADRGSAGRSLGKEGRPVASGTWNCRQDAHPPE